MTVADALLRRAGAMAVLPFALAVAGVTVPEAGSIGAAKTFAVGGLDSVAATSFANASLEGERSRRV